MDPSPKPLQREVVLPHEHPHASMMAAVLLSALLFSMVSSWMMFAAAAAQATPRAQQSYLATCR